MKPCYLIIDQGGHGTRALVFNTRGEIVLASRAALVTTHPASGWIEQSATALTRSVQHCLNELSVQLASHRLHIKSAALITQRSSLLACDKNSLQAITPVISWQDTRNSDWLQQHMDDGQFNISELKKLTGLRLNAHYGASKIRWLLDHDIAVQKANAQGTLLFLPLAAFVTHLLTNSNRAVVDAATASRTFLTEFGLCAWSPTLLRLFAIDRHVLPDIVGSKADFGDITIGDKTIPLQVVGGDQSFLPFAYGKKALSDALFINVGTGAFVQTQLSRAETPYALLSSLATIDGEQQLTVAEGTVNACASALDWLFAQEQQTLSHEQISTALDQVSSPPVFFHRITALGSPYWLAIGESSFSGVSSSNQASLPAKTVAVIESIIFLLAINIDLLQQSKTGLQKILISGGLSNLDGFCQKLANVAQLPVLRCADPEASARGAAFYLANISDYPLLDSASTFVTQEDRPLLARYQRFYEWLRNEWMQNSH